MKHFSLFAVFKTPEMIQENMPTEKVLSLTLDKHIREAPKLKA